MDLKKSPPAFQLYQSRKGLYDLVAQGSCQIIAAAVGACGRSRLGARRQDQKISPESTAGGPDAEACPVPLHCFRSAFRHDPDLQALCLFPQSVQHRLGLAGGRVDIPIPVCDHHAQTAEKGDRVCRRKPSDGRHGEIRGPAAVAVRSHIQVSQIALSVSCGKDLLSHPGHMLQDRHPYTVFCRRNGRHKSGGSAAMMIPSGRPIASSLHAIAVKMLFLVYPPGV